MSALPAGGRGWEGLGRAEVQQQLAATRWRRQQLAAAGGRLQAGRPQPAGCHCFFTDRRSDGKGAAQAADKPGAQDAAKAAGMPPAGAAV